MTNEEKHYLHISLILRVKAYLNFFIELGDHFNGGGPVENVFYYNLMQNPSLDSLIGSTSAWYH